LADRLLAVRRGFFGWVAPSSLPELSDAARVPYNRGRWAIGTDGCNC
jgi:hypothetical protein